jgi:hypothetical protein
MEFQSGIAAEANPAQASDPVIISPPAILTRTAPWLRS